MENSSTEKTIEAKEKKMLTRKSKRLIFYVLLFAIPTIQYAIMGIYVKFDSLLMAFEVYRPDVGGYDVSYVFLDNFKAAFNYVADRPQLITNSLIVFVCCAIPGLTLAILSSYYIYKKFFLSKAFMFILFLPKIIAPIVFSIIFGCMAEDLFTAMMTSFGKTDAVGLLTEGSTTIFPTLVIYTLFMSICGNILLYIGGMTSINDSVVEYAQIDGVNFWQEFFHIVLPGIFPTVVTFLTVSISQIFSAQMHLFDFFSYGANANIQTLGYNYFVNIVQSDVVSSDPTKYLSWPQLTALGFMIMLVMIPITLVTKKLLYKYGPSDE